MIPKCAVQQHLFNPVRRQTRLKRVVERKLTKRRPTSAVFHERRSGSKRARMPSADPGLVQPDLTVRGEAIAIK